jgi:hypothetical protein
MSPEEVTDDERRLWERYFRWNLPIAEQYNAKTWPVNVLTPVDAARYIGTFVYVYHALRTNWLLDSKEGPK